MGVSASPTVKHKMLESIKDIPSTRDPSESYYDFWTKWKQVPESAKLFFKKWANPSLLIVYFRFFLNTISIIQTEKSVDGVVGIQTHGRRMVGPDDTTDLCQTFYLVAFSDNAATIEIVVYTIHEINMGHIRALLCSFSSFSQ